MRKYLLTAFIASFILSEIIIRINTIIGFFIYGTLITGCLIALSKDELNNEGKLITVLMILPIIRIAQLFIIFNEFWKDVIPYYALLFLAVLYSAKFGVKQGYSSKWISLLPLTFIIGILMGILSKSIFNQAGHAELLLFVPVIVFSEEIFFRGLIQNLIMNEKGVFSSILFPSLIYAIFGIGFGIWAAVFLFFVSVVICLIYYYTRNIFLGISISLILHILLFLS